MEQTAMMQLLAQLRNERNNMPLNIEWDRCYQAIEHVIENTYLPLEKEQVDSRVKDLEKRLFNCSKDNADLMAKLQNIPTYDDVRKSIESALTEEQVLTAEEFLDSQHNIIPSTEFDIRKVMIEFAKLHVEEALK